MSAAHTPGPWAVKFRNDHSAYISLGDPIKGPHKQFDIEFDDRYPSDVADARLIAAAPELLSVVKDFRDKLTTYVSVYPGDKQLRRQLTDCDAAIAKATGAAS